ncbi:type II toxin-antitoxin system RelE/ParE family toxin [Aquibium carbonis]|uniref:Type II toxin-antitoxin system RelE/ParE family toxin n=1 Tax=Aquibium carbonis TaxID=2495581 RepID=A0A3S0AA66_9HYPH|nr:type II toxin-antitoxin system RelE/ParE family toxin [Aquibium carbonis]RST88172.1 type II toxin-antitoxin system RelE/ParE family toxin [Aquibium carbonis]
MTRYFIQPAASARLEEIYRHTFRQFGPAQADRYLDGVFALFEDIAKNRVAWQRVPSEFGVDGFFARYKSHFIFWKPRADGQIAIVAILHQRMDLARRLREDVPEP